MKKIVLMVTAMMTVTFSFAGTENTNSVVTNVENYDMSFDMRRLAAKLDLTSDQMEAVQVIQDNFNDEMKSAATAEVRKRSHKVHHAVRKDIHLMHNVLDKEQFHTYVALLFTTLHNKGL